MGLAHKWKQVMLTHGIELDVADTDHLVAVFAKEGIVENRIYDLIAAPKKEKKLPLHLNKRQVLEILESVDDGTFSGCRDRAILELLSSKFLLFIADDSGRIR